MATHSSILAWRMPGTEESGGLPSMGSHRVGHNWCDLPAGRQSNGKGNGKPLQYSCLENPMDGGAWWAAVHGVAKSRTWLRDFTFSFHFHTLEKEMATHSSVLAWRIPGTGKPGGLPSMGSHRVGHDWSDLEAAADRANQIHYKDKQAFRDTITRIPHHSCQTLSLLSLSLFFFNFFLFFFFILLSLLTRVSWAQLSFTASLNTPFMLQNKSLVWFCSCAWWRENLKTENIFTTS